MAEDARPKYDVAISVEAPFRGRLDRAALRRRAVRVLKAEGVAPPAEVGFVVTGDETVRDLNRRYLGLDEPTDVLSFGHEPFDPSTLRLSSRRRRVAWATGQAGSGRGRLRTEPFDRLRAQPFVTPPDSVRRLGEVILSYPTAERQAREAGRSVQAEAAHLVVHGLLHFLGYDHANPEDERRMRAREEELLRREAH
jgi:probable rRNA maturation factor